MDAVTETLANIVLSQNVMGRYPGVPKNFDSGCVHGSRKADASFSGTSLHSSVVGKPRQSNGSLDGGGRYREFSFEGASLAKFSDGKSRRYASTLL